MTIPLATVCSPMSRISQAFHQSGAADLHPISETSFTENFLPKTLLISIFSIVL